jgi:hypothetical protein
VKTMLDTMTNKDLIFTSIISMTDNSQTHDSSAGNSLQQPPQA